MKQQLGIIVEALETINLESRDASISSSARGHLKRISEFEFYISMTFVMPIFEITDRLSTQLQGKTVSTGHGVQLVRQAIEESTEL